MDIEVRFSDALSTGDPTTLRDDHEESLFLTSDGIAGCVLITSVTDEPVSPDWFEVEVNLR
ncbi:hypothetical protein B0A49_12675, partial [Cryomyces minteri]